MVEFTLSQKTAIDTRGQDILVSAGAGSGKTAVLTSRITSLITDNEIPADRILVLTFTRSAAQEMKNRIRLMLRQAAVSSTFAAEQMAILDEAPISTLHAFCSAMIHKYFYIIGADPAIRILSATEAALLRKQAIASVFESRFLTCDDAFLSLMDKLTGLYGIDTFMNLITGLYDFTRNYPDPEGWLDFALDTSSKNLQDSPAAAAVRAAAGQAAAIAGELCIQALTICRKYGEEKRIAWFENMAVAASDLEGAARKDLVCLIDSLSNIKVPRYDMRRQMPESDTVREIQKNIKQIIDDTKKDFPFSLSRYEAMQRDIELDTAALISLIRDFAAAFAAAKESRSVMDYSDLEHGMLAILDNPAALKAITESFDAVLVDEYQDTNRIQEAIVEKIARRGTLFAVGDIKQSIYRFRQADPSIFMDRYDRCREDEAAGKLIFLNENFRTSKSIINSLNDMFSRIFTRICGGADYVPDGLLTATVDDCLAGPVRIVLADGRSESQSIEDPESGRTVYEREGEVIASIIQEMIEGKVPVADKATGGTRPIEYGDIAVISRSLSSSHAAYEAALAKACIPYSSSLPGEYYDEEEVSLTLSILSLIDNANDDFPLLGVLRSFLYDFSADELLAVRNAAPEEYYYSNALHAYLADNPDTLLANKLRSFQSDFSRLREISRHISLRDLLRIVYEEMRLPSVFSAMPDGEKRLENLAYLEEMAASFEESSFHGLHHFLAWVDERRSYSASGEQQSSKPMSDRVRIMSVHASKGLEFDAVIVAGITRRFNRADERSPVLADKKLGLCLRWADVKKGITAASLPLAAAKVSISDENASEEMRLLYVASTRAKQYLTYTGTLRSNPPGAASEPSAYLIRSKSSWWDWMALAFAASIEGFDPHSPDFENDKFSLEIRPAFAADAEAEDPEPDQEQEQNPVQEEVYAGDEEVKTAALPDEDILISRLSFVYPHEKAAAIPSKLSATTLASMESLRFAEKLVDIAGPPSFSKAPLTGARRGTLTHLVMEKLNVSLFTGTASPSDELERELARIAAAGFLTDEEAVVIDKGAIIDFLGSPLGIRLAASGNVHMETPFLINVPAYEVDSREFASLEDPVIVQGTIDCFFESGDELILIDYKTDAYVEEQQLQKYLRQLDIYAKAIAQTRGAGPSESILVLLTRRLLVFSDLHNQVRSLAY